MISKALTQFGSDKDTDHTYGWLYDGILAAASADSNFVNTGEQISVLEIGVQFGNSARAFMSEGCRYVGIDKDLPPAVPNSTHVNDVIRCVSPDFSNAGRRFDSTGELFHLVIDDGSHTRECQAAAIVNFWNYMHPGRAIMVIEDIQDESSVDHLIANAMSLDYVGQIHFIDMRKVKGRVDDMIIVIEKPGVDVVSGLISRQWPQIERVVRELGWGSRKAHVLEWEVQ